jgi:DNA-binding response OmpR family regulator
MAATVMIVEDEKKLRDFIRSYFEGEGITVLSAASGGEAITLTHSSQPDLVILDLGLPDVPGEEVLKELRRFTDIPILVLTAKTMDTDRIRGLELGADDYITKPFSPRELVLRSRAILRRTSVLGDNETRMSFGQGRLILDHARREVRADGRIVPLTPTEWGLLVALTSMPGRVYSRFELINRVRGYEFEGYERTIDSHVKNLRHKIERNARNPQIIETVLGGGYRLGLASDD